MNEEFKRLVGKQTIYLGNIPLIHELGDFFNIKITQVEIFILYGERFVID